MTRASATHRVNASRSNIAIARSAATGRGPDVTPPNISAIDVTPTATTFGVTWTTDEIADTQIVWGLSTRPSDTGGTGYAFSSSLADTTTRVLSHIAGAAGLTEQTPYFFRVKSRDSSGNLSVSTEQSTTTTSLQGTWTSSGTLSGVTLGTLQLDPTYESIAIHMDFTETSGTIATTKAYFRKASTPDTVRLTVNGGEIPTLRPSGQQAMMRASVLLCTPATLYEVKIEVTDNSGNTRTVVGTATTWTDAIPAASSLTPTHYVNPVTGSDSNNGTGTGTPWQTLGKAIAVANAASANMVIQLADGFYALQNTALAPGNGHTITFKAEHPAVDDSQVEINAGQHAVIVGIIAGPTGASEALTTSNGPLTIKGPWVSVTPDGNGAHPLYKWANIPAAQANFNVLGYSSTISGATTRVPKWLNSGVGVLDTAAHWATTVWTNQTQFTGYWVDPGSGYIDVYARFPTGVDPNTMYCFLGQDSHAGIQVAGGPVRMTGLEFRCCYYGLELDSVGHDVIIDHCLFQGNRIGIAELGNSTTHAAYGTTLTVERCRFIDQGFYNESGGGISWSFIKASIKLADNSNYGNRVGGDNETCPINGSGGWNHGVYRHNTIDGTYNGDEWSSSGYDRWASYNKDVYSNTYKHLCDDAVEPEYAISNLKVWDCYMDHTQTFLSTGPVYYGPVYLFRNRAFQTGPWGIADSVAGVAYTGLGAKYSGTSSPRGKIYIVNCTMYATINRAGSLTSGAEQSAGGGANTELFWYRNCIFRATRYSAQFTNVDSLDEDYCLWATSDSQTTHGQAIFGTAYRSQAQVDPYRKVWGVLGTIGGGVVTSIPTPVGFPTASPTRPPIAASSPTCVISQDGGTRALATVNTANGVITGFTITNAGTGYTHIPSVTISTGAFQRGQHSNVLNGVDIAFTDTTTIDALFTDAVNGDLTLHSGTNYAKNAGIIVDNIADISGTNYTGIAPHLGYTP